jgi:hypothetical protein
MDGYRAFIIGPSGHIVNRVDIMTDDEAEARRLAVRVDERSPVELWQGATMIERFEPSQRRAVSHVIKSGRMIPKEGL